MNDDREESMSETQVDDLEAFTAEVVESLAPDKVGFKPDISMFPPGVRSRLRIMEPGDWIAIQYKEGWRDTMVWIVKSIADNGDVRLHVPHGSHYGMTNWITGPTRYGQDIRIVPKGTRFNSASETKRQEQAKTKEQRLEAREKALEERNARMAAKRAKVKAKKEAFLAERARKRQEKATKREAKLKDILEKREARKLARRAAKEAATKS